MWGRQAVGVGGPPHRCWTCWICCLLKEEILPKVERLLRGNMRGREMSGPRLPNSVWSKAQGRGPKKFSFHLRITCAVCSSQFLVDRNIELTNQPVSQSGTGDHQTLNWGALSCPWASQVALVVKDQPTNEGDRRDVGWSLGQEDCLEEGVATHSSVLAWRIPWTEEPGGL